MRGEMVLRYELTLRVSRLEGGGARRRDQRIGKTIPSGGEGRLSDGYHAHRRHKHKCGRWIGWSGDEIDESGDGALDEALAMRHALTQAVEPLDTLRLMAALPQPPSTPGRA